MAGLLDDRVALITGAGSGIGEAIAHAMAHAGARIAAVDVDDAAARHTAGAIGRGAADFACDVTHRAGCDGLAAAVRSQIGAVSILVNNAGIIRRGTVMEPNAREDWDATLAVNLDGPYNMVTAFLDQLRETKGSITHRLDSVLCGPAELGGIYDLEGRRAPVDQGACDRALSVRHSRQRDRPRFHRHPAQCQGAGRCRLHGQFREPDPARPYWHARGYRWARRFSRLRHGALHHRRHSAGRRGIPRTLVFSLSRTTTNTVHGPGGGPRRTNAVGSAGTL
jgi:short chain dehydrogenase